MISGHETQSPVCWACTGGTGAHHPVPHGSPAGGGRPANLGHAGWGLQQRARERHLQVLSAAKAFILL